MPLRNKRVAITSNRVLMFKSINIENIKNPSRRRRKQK